MEYTEDIQLILSGLYRDRTELTTKLAGVERLIKKIKKGEISFDNNSTSTVVAPDTITNNDEAKQIDFPLRGELRVQVISVIDSIGVACKLKEIQQKYKELTGLNVNLRETVRNLYKHDILRLLKPIGTERGLYWVKSEWLEDNFTKLKEEHKFVGFGLLYNDAEIEYIN